MNVTLLQYRSLEPAPALPDVTTAFAVDEAVVCKYLNAIVEIRHTLDGLQVVARPFESAPAVTLVVEDPNMAQLGADIRKAESRTKRKAR